MPHPQPAPDQVPQPERRLPLDRTDEVLDPVLPVEDVDELPSPLPADIDTEEESEDGDDVAVPADLLDDGTPFRAVRLWRRVLH